MEPVTLGGWYEHADGTVGEYRWLGGHVRLVRTEASWADVPSHEDDLDAAIAADNASHEVAS